MTFSEDDLRAALEMLNLGPPGDHILIRLIRLFFKLDLTQTFEIDRNFHQKKIKKKSFSVNLNKKSNIFF